MHSYERVITALAGEQPDRVPVLTYLNGESPNISDRLRELVLSSTDVFHTRRLYTGFGCTGETAETREEPLDDGWVRITYQVAGQSFDEICKSGEAGSYVGYRKHIIADPLDIERLLEIPFARAEENPRLDDWVAEVNSAAHSLHSRGEFMRIVIHDPLCLLAINTDPDDLSIWTIERRALLRQYFDCALARVLSYLEYALERIDAPVVFNMSGAEYALPPLMSPREFDEFVLVYDRQIIDLVHSYDRRIYCHSHGKVRSFLPRFVEMGADGLHPLEPVGATGDCDIGEVKAEFAGDICLIGNIQYDDLARLPGHMVRDLVRDVVLSAKPGGGFMLSPSCTPFHNPMPISVEDNIIRFIEAGLEYGRY